MPKNYLTFIALMLTTFVLGSVHAFSVYITSLESLLELPRSEISLIYSFALVSITISVLVGYRIYAALPAWLLVLLTTLTAALGLFISAGATNWWLLFFGYSVLFGISNGIGYGFALQLVAHVLPAIKGFAMCAVTASYAVGSVVFAKLSAVQIASVSLASALNVLGVTLLVCSVLSACLLWLSKAEYPRQNRNADSADQKIELRMLVLFWFAYMFSVFAGLMAIGHAAGIALSSGASITLSVWSAMIIGLGSAAGGFLCGCLVDRWTLTRFLVGLPLVSAASLLSLSVVGSPYLVVILLCVVGFSYGSVIAIYPVAISNYFADQGPKAYGLIFTAWGFAGLLAPWTAGLFYDRWSDYKMALVVASVTAVLSALTVGLSQFEKQQSPNQE